MHAEIVHSTTSSVFLIGQSNISYQSLSTKSWWDGTENSSNLGSKTEGSGSLPQHLAWNWKCTTFIPSSCLTRYKRPCNSLTLLAKARTKRKLVFGVRCLSKDNFGGSNSRRVWLSRTKAWFDFSGLISLGKQFFPKLLNILPMILFSGQSMQARGNT